MASFYFTKGFELKIISRPEQVEKDSTGLPIGSRVLGAMMPRYDMDMAGTRQGYGKDMHFTRKMCSIGYYTTIYVAYFVVFMHHSLGAFPWSSIALFT